MEETVFKICVIVILTGAISTFLFLCWLLG